MNALYWIDVAALCSSAIIAFSLIVTVSGSGIRRSLNRNFALFAATEAFWAVCSLLLRLSLWLERGNPQLLAELVTLAIPLMGITLLMFVARYIGRPTIRNNIAVVVGLDFGL